MFKHECTIDIERKRGSRPPAKKKKKNTSRTQRPVVCIVYERLKAHLENGLGSDPFHRFSQESSLNSAFHTRATVNGVRCTAQSVTRLRREGRDAAC